MISDYYIEKKKNNVPFRLSVGEASNICAKNVSWNCKIKSNAVKILIPNVSCQRKDLYSLNTFEKIYVLKTLKSCCHRSFDDGAVKLQLAADNQSNCWLKAGNQIEKVAPFYCHNIAKTCRGPWNMKEAGYIWQFLSEVGLSENHLSWVGNVLRKMLQ